MCLNEKEETYYRAYDGIKSTIDLGFRKQRSTIDAISKITPQIFQ